jgi:hypothetical protein
MILAVSVVRCGDAAICKGREAAGNLAEEALRLEELWKGGKTSEYYQQASKIAEEILSGDATDTKDEAAAELLESLLSKAAVSTKATTYYDLFAMRKVASYLIPPERFSAEERRINARLLSKFLGEIRNEIVPNYQDRPVTMNVAPPPGTPCAVAGMDPDAIDDPVARAQYKEAIRQNDENNLMNTRQFVLRNIELELSTHIVAYLIDAFQAPGTPQSLVDECIKNAKLTDAERKELESKISKKE